MTLQAQQIDIAQLQHARVRPTMRHVAGLTSIDLYGCVLEHEWSLQIRVTLEADRILRGRSSHLLGLHRTVHVVAITALDQPFIYSMVERHVELGFLLEMA